MITNENRSIEDSDVTYVRTEDLETVPAPEGGDDPREGVRTASKVSTIDIRIAGVSEMPKSGLIADGGRLEIISHFSMWEVAAFHSLVYSNNVVGAGRAFGLGLSCGRLAWAGSGEDEDAFESPTIADASKTLLAGFGVPSKDDPEGRNIPPPTVLFRGAVAAVGISPVIFEDELPLIERVETGVKRTSGATAARDSGEDEEFLLALVLDLTEE